MKHLVLVFIICSAINFVYLQEVTESSGDSLTSVSTSLTTDWLQSETASSGEGPVISTLLDNVDLIDESNNGTDFIDSSLLKNGELSNETSATSSSSTLSWTTSETMSPSITTSSIQTTPEPSTTSTTTSPTTTTTATTTTTTTSPPPTTTTTVKTTTSPSTTTTLKTTTSTTRRPTTTASTTTKKTTKNPLPVTVPSIKPSSQVEAPCEFIEENFVCDAEISCFGEGIIDCTITEDELVPDAPNVKSSSAAPSEETDDYEEESATVGFFPPELIGRVPPRFSFPWNIKPENSEKSEVSSESTTTVGTSSQSLTSMASTTITTTTTEKQDSTSMVTSSVSSTSQINTMDKFPSTFAQQNMTSISPSIITEIIGESSTFSVNNVTNFNSTDAGHIENGSFEIPATSSEVVTGVTESNVNPTTEFKNIELPSAIGVRRKRDSKRKDSPSSSESLKLTVDDSKKRIKSCKVSGHLHCTPTPTTASCRGRGTCKVISVEKTEKSTSSKGVENWAIAVIAICATAAVLTIGLLVYLVVTSWKKLKVQPQNGVTTLNYVNSSPP